MNIDLSNPMGAIFSLDGQHRYALWRVWSQARPPLLFIGLNPSTASNTKNDPTVRVCMRRADEAGFGALLVGNLYSLVSSIPSPLTWREDAVGEKTDYYLQQMIDLAARVLCGWGSFKAVGARASAVLDMIPEPYCLGINKSGQPRHPLYVPLYYQMYTIKSEKEK